MDILKSNNSQPILQNNQHLESVNKQFTINSVLNNCDLKTIRSFYTSNCYYSEKNILYGFFGAIILQYFSIMIH